MVAQKDPWLILLTCGLPRQNPRPLTWIHTPFPAEHTESAKSKWKSEAMVYRFGMRTPLPIVNHAHKTLTTCATPLYHKRQSPEPALRMPLNFGKFGLRRIFLSC